MKHKIWFIVNPVSGTGIPIDFLKGNIEDHLSLEKYSFAIKITQYKNHAFEIAQEAIKESINIIVAVGGDGTVNEIVKAIIGESIILGIIPVGSGNGLARHLRISFNIKETLHHINQRRLHKVDVGYMNETPFLVVAGIGFDAHIAKVFNYRKHKRGLWSYVKIILLEYFLNYRYIECRFLSAKQKFFMITFCNVSDVGNNVYLGPDAQPDNGFLDCVVTKPDPFFMLKRFIMHNTGQKIKESRYVKLLRKKEYTVLIDSPMTFQCDGEVNTAQPPRIEVRIRKSAINIIIPPTKDAQ